MKSTECRYAVVLILGLLIAGFPAGRHLHAQFISSKKLEKMDNDILPGEVGVKYIYTFPVEKTDVRMAENGQQLEIPVYDNELLITPIMDKVLDGSITVYDPNYWGDVYKLKGNAPIRIIDTARILKYMSAGADTAMFMDMDGNVSLMPAYVVPDFTQISGIFFMENWLVNLEEPLFHKEIVAYLPIRDYYIPSEDELKMEKQRRLLFMVIPGRSAGMQANTVKAGDYSLICNDISYELGLYNKPYSDYIYSNEIPAGIDREEYEEWMYHHFDFYEFFNRDFFLNVLLTAILNGELTAYQVEEPLHPLSSGQLEELQRIETEEINSVIFYEDWYLDLASLAMEKAVKRVVLVRHVRDYDEYTGEYIRTRKVPLLLIRF